VQSLQELVDTETSPRVLSIGCGYLREAHCCRAVRDGKIGEYFALDQDPATVAEVGRLHPKVKAKCGAVRSLLDGKVRFEGLDFIYAAGLFDYLSAPVATRLIARMFCMLRSGGRLLAVNFAPNSPEIGYMEACMDWWLTYRNEGQVRMLSKEVPGSDIRRERLFRDEFNNLVFLEIEKW
jgi:SAM-dependent methyltransferase